MKTLEVVWGYAAYYSLSKSKFSENEILQFNTLFNLGDISDLESKEIKKIPKKLIFETSDYNFERELNILLKVIKAKQKIRIWTSRYDIYSYLILLFTCYIAKDKVSNIYVVYSDDYDKYCISPGMIESLEFEKLEKFEQKLSLNEIAQFANAWNLLMQENSEMRILNNGKIESVKLNYYDDLILSTLKKLGAVKISGLVANLMVEKHLSEHLWLYLVNLLIKGNKIKLIEVSDERDFNNIVEVYDNIDI